ncbi:MAG: hypothetical protein ABI644_00950 [Arenimonas sp.]
MIRNALLATLLITATGRAENPPDTMQLLDKHLYGFSYDKDAISGRGADFLRTETENSQFVLLGEQHMDHAIPVFSGALYRMLHDTHGFRHLVVEQDPVAIEDAISPELRGKPEKIARLSKRYPSLFEFDSDEDLTLLATVGQLEGNPDAIWGVEQATGAVRYLEELLLLAPNQATRRKTQTLLDKARAMDHEPKYSVNWLIAASTPAEISALSSEFNAEKDTRAAWLLAALTKSSEIFGYYRRAEAGEFVGLFNNTVREETLKKNFIEKYRNSAKREVLPKAMFKFGSNHLYHGKNPTQAFPIGNMAHEFAIVNGMQAYGIYVISLGPNYASYKDYPDWMRPLLPIREPEFPTLVDLRGLRPYQRLYREKVPSEDQWQFRDFINGYDAVIILPNSKPATRVLGGRVNY